MEQPRIALDSSSRVDDMRARLKELGSAIYGTKEELWARLVKSEAQAKRDREVAEALAQRREEEMRGEVTPAPVRSPPQPGEPTEAERLAHYLTHLPPAKWCKFCMMGRAQQDPHRSVSWEARSVEFPLVQFDFCYFKSDLSIQDEMAGAWATTLVGVDEQTGCLFAVTLDSKLLANEYMHKSAVWWIDEYLRLMRIKLQGDNEPALQAMFRYVKLVRKHETSK